MSKSKAADCPGCKYWREGLLFKDRKPKHGVFRICPDGWFFACLRDHKPRFYKSCYQPAYDWGWKRRCLDYALRKD